MFIKQWIPIVGGQPTGSLFPQRRLLKSNRKIKPCSDYQNNFYSESRSRKGTIVLWQNDHTSSQTRYRGTENFPNSILYLVLWIKILTAIFAQVSKTISDDAQPNSRTAKKIMNSRSNRSIHNIYGQLLCSLGYSRVQLRLKFQGWYLYLFPVYIYKFLWTLPDINREDTDTGVSHILKKWIYLHRWFLHPLYNLTSVCIFSTVFPKYFLWCWQVEFV